MKKTDPSADQNAAARPSTRVVLLEIAGRLFAERGYAATTGREICLAAGVNTASVNYHFGGRERLYREALAEARRRAADIADLDELAASDLEPEKKLALFLERLLASARLSSDQWGIRLLLREMASPALGNDSRMEVLPWLAPLRTIISQTAGSTPSSAELDRLIGLALLPCVSVLLVSEPLRALLLPGSDSDVESAGRIAAFLAGGLKALK